MPTHPKDRFDTIPHALNRVGAHRAPGRKGRGWVAFWWALAITLVLIAAGVFGLYSLTSRLNFTIPGIPTGTATTTEEPVAEPTAEPTVDPALTVTVLNGTAGAGLAGDVGEILTDAGWTVGSTGNSSAQDVASTTVYYSDAALEGAARGVAASIPGAAVLLANDFADSGAELTVIVGNDYVAPVG